MSLISEPQFTNIIKPGIFKVFVNYFNDLPRESLVGAMYRLEQSERSKEDYLELTDSDKSKIESLFFETLKEEMETLFPFLKIEKVEFNDYWDKINNKK